MLFAFSAAALMLSGCASLAGAGSDSPMPERTIKARTPSEVVTAPKKDRESALRLARMLVAQGRYEGALGVYAELDRRGGMDAKTLLEYAGIASLIEPPRATLTLFTRTKALAEAEKVKFAPAEEAGLLTGLGRAYMASARMSDARSALARAVELDDKNVSTALFSMLRVSTRKLSSTLTRRLPSRRRMCRCLPTWRSPSSA